jgi:hypothetical protein
MTLKTSLVTAVAGAMLLIAVPVASGQSEPAYTDAIERAVTARELSSRLDASVLYGDAFGYSDAHKRAALAGPPIVSTGGQLGDSHDRIVPASRAPVSVVSSGRDLEWPQIGVGFGVGILLALGLGMGMRLTRIRQPAH